MIAKLIFLILSFVFQKAAKVKSTSYKKKKKEVNQHFWAKVKLPKKKAHRTSVYATLLSMKRKGYRFST